MRDFAPLSDRLNSDAGNVAGVIAALSPSAKIQLEDTLTTYLAKLPERDVKRVYAETVGRFNADAMLYCEEDFPGGGSSTNLVDARGMSDGTLRFLAVLTALLTRPTGSLLIIEEVDNGLHPSRSNLLLKVLRDVGESRSVDLVITTHNPALLNAMGTEMVPFITVAHRDQETGHTQLTLLEDIDQLPKLLSQGAIGTLSSRGLIEKALKSAEGSTKGVFGQMGQRVLIIDTSVLCCFLKVPGKETAGSGKSAWDYEKAFNILSKDKATRVLPLATLIETGNHVAQAKGDRHPTSQALADIIRQAASAKSPWAAFADQADLWQPDELLALAETWPGLALGGTSIGDATIKTVAEYYAKAGFEVEIVTGDEGLKAYQPVKPVSAPRRRQ